MNKKIVFLPKYSPLLHLKLTKTYFISTPIYYPNDKPHIGHFYTNCLADVLARWHRLKGHDVLFSTGTDEHGLKIQKAAENRNVNCRHFVDESANNYRNLFHLAGFSHSDFIRTTEERHKTTVRNIWEMLMKKNCLFKGKYSGWYSVIEESFIPNNSKMKDYAENSLEWCEEENWMFDIEKFKPEIRKWVNSGSIYPKNFLPFVTEFIDEINTVSVSRPSHRIQWGIPVPDDTDQTIYVWLDALINYLTVSKTETGKVWPLDLQVIGKDIIKFHLVLWPAILLALDLELPKKVLIHSHWLKNGVKMSKSVGNVVDPHIEAEILGGYEQLKYFLLSEDAIESDSTYDSDRAVDRVDNHLVNVTGNLLQRICSPKINPLQRIGVDMDITDSVFPGSEYEELLVGLRSLPTTFENHMDSLNIHSAIDSVIKVLRQTNVFFDSQRPWRSSDNQTFRDAVIYVSSESLRMCGILLQCVVPKFADRLLGKVSIPVEQRTLAEMYISPQRQRHFRYLQHFDGDNILLSRIRKHV